MNIATPAADRKSFFALQNLIFEHPYFEEDRPLSRRERAAWIAKHVLWKDNCVLKRGQGQWSLRYLSEAWKCPKTTVERFLKKLESIGVIALCKRVVNGTAQMVITYLFSGTYRTDDTVGGTEPGRDRDSSGTKTNTGNSGKTEREDSCQAKGPDVWDGSFPGTDPEADSSSPTPPPNPRPSRAAEFEPIWKAMPPMARKRGSKQEALKEWCKLNGGERVDAARGVKFWERNEFAMAAERWLKRKMWVGLLELELEPVGAQSRASKW